MRALTETKVIRFFNHSHGPQNQDYQHRDKHQRGFTAGFVEDSHESPQLRQTCCVKKEVCYFVRLGDHNKILKNMFLPVFEALRNASRVVGGGDAGFGRFPWMALVRGTHTRYILFLWLCLSSMCKIDSRLL